MIVLAFDTATADTVVGLQVGERPALAARHTPGAGERPGHAAQVLGLARGLMAEARVTWADVDRVGVGTGPGTFTGLRIGVATARGLVQGGGQELVAVPTLEALARGAAAPAVLACLDARRGEAYVGAWLGDTELLDGPRAVAPEALADVLALAAAPWVAVGDGAVRFRAPLEAAGAEVPPDDAAAHHVDGAWLCALAAAADPVARDALEPEYVRALDAVPSRP